MKDKILFVSYSPNSINDEASVESIRKTIKTENIVLINKKDISKSDLNKIQELIEETPSPNIYKIERISSDEEDIPISKESRYKSSPFKRSCQPWKRRNKNNKI